MSPKKTQGKESNSDTEHKSAKTIDLKALDFTRLYDKLHLLFFVTTQKTAEIHVI